ncbi:hypothetical protein NLN86_19850 [Citrobacter portucalensis]|uniref:Molecular chaperone DnaJ n=1 Tax=Citrobacter portucalensis TaxID=1639133 RepID=A0AAW5W6C2_9ENTR|nr:hypothetical protein [Citrobacter portucalensis]MCX9003888.1 hypothetical protein [Citrobacter portucalensis]
MTTNHPAHGPVSLDRLHQISEILSKAAAQSDGGNLGYAMADAVKVIDGAIAERSVETIYQVMYGECWRDITEEQYHYHAIHESPIRIVYTAPPAQLVNTIDETLIEALRLVQCMLDDYRERNYGHAQEWIRHISAKMDDYSEQHGDDAYSVISAAMLQAGNSPVTPYGYVLVPKKLTAENGAKSVLSGEFSETKFINCPECFGDDDCETCDGSGRIEITVPVTWTTIKSIWAKGVEHFAAGGVKGRPQ